MGGEELQTSDEDIRRNFNQLQLRDTDTRYFLTFIFIIYLLDTCDVIPRTPGRSIVGMSVPVPQSSFQIILVLMGSQHTPYTTQIHKRIFS